MSRLKESSVELNVPGPATHRLGQSTRCSWLPNHIHLVSRPVGPGSPTTFTWSVDQVFLVPQPYSPGQSTRCFWFPNHIHLVSRPGAPGPQPHSPGQSTRCSRSATSFTWSVDQVLPVRNLIHLVSDQVLLVPNHIHLVSRPSASGPQPHRRGQSTRSSWSATSSTGSVNRDLLVRNLIDGVGQPGPPGPQPQMASTCNLKPQQSG